MLHFNEHFPADSIFTPYTQQILHRAGWHAERHVNIDAETQALQQYGYTVHDAAQIFLKSFSGIVLDYELASQYGNLRFVTHFIIAHSLIHIDELTAYEQYAGQPFCIIGETGNQHITLIMSQRGKVYGCNDDTLHFYGHSGAEAIEQIVHADVERFTTS